MSDKKFILGVDIGGTHISCAGIDLESEKIITGSKRTYSVDSSESANEILDIWISTIKDTCGTESTPAGIGIAMPGPFDYEKGICKIKGVGKYDALFDLNIKEMFSSSLSIPGENIKFLNDASCFGLGEYYAGAGKHSKRMAAITLGTGFGSALISNGEIVTGGEYAPEGGMFWNVPYKEGIADDYFSSRWFVDNYYKKTGIKVSGVSDIAGGHKGDRTSQNLFNEFAQNLSWFLLPWLKLFDAEILVIGGSIAKAHDLFVPLMQYIFAGEGVKIDIKLSELWEDAAIIGSANLFKKS